MNSESNGQERHSSQLNIPISLTNIPAEKGRSSSNFNAMIDQIEQNQLLSPLNKKVPKSISLPKKVDNIQKNETRAFSVKKIDNRRIEVQNQSIRHSQLVEPSSIINSNAKTSTNFRIKSEDTNDAIQQFKILRDQLQSNIKSQFEQQNTSSQLPTSTIRFIFKDKEEKHNESQEEKNKPQIQKLENGMRKSTEAFRNRRYKSNINQNRDASNVYINDQVENNLKKSFAEKNTPKQIIETQDKAFGRKCMSSRDIYMTNMQNSFQITQLQSQDILNPLKQQMSSFIGSKYLKENGKNFSLNNTPQKKINNEVEQNLNQSQGNQSNQLVALQAAKNLPDIEHKKNTGPSAANTAYKNYLNRIIQKQQQLYTKPNQFEFSSSYGTPGSSTLRNSHLNQANSLNNTKYIDSTQKKSIMHNIFLKDKDQVSLEEFSLRSKKQETSDSSNSRIELPPLMFPASKKDLEEFQKLQNKDELRFSREHKQNHLDQEEYKGAFSANNSTSSQDDKAQRKKHFQSINSLSSFFKQKSDSLRIMEMVQERNQIIQQQKLKQQAENIQHENKQNQQFIDLIKENMNNRFMSPSPNKLKANGMKAQSQAIIVTDVSDLIKHRQNPSITNLPIQNQVSPQRGSQKLIKIPSKLYTTITNIAINNELQLHSPQATFTRFPIRKQKTEYNKGPVTLKSIGSQQHFDVDSDELISQQQKAQHVASCEKDLAKETNFVDYLQQQKIFIRQSLEQFLKDRPRVFKNISRNCLMDQEQFVFFMMSFIQFCIDDMFDEFKKEYYIKLAQNNRTNDRVSLVNIPCNSIVESESVHYKFGQKIPEEIMKQVIDAIVNCLQNQSKEVKKQPSIEEFSNDNGEQEKQQLSQKRKSQGKNIGEDDEQKYIIQGLDRFFKKIQSNVEKYILPQTLIDKLGGFARLRLLLIAGVKTFNNYINNASKMSYIEEKDETLIDKYLMPFFCTLINEDKETMQMLIGIFKQHKHQFSHYDYFSIKKIIWDTLNTIKLDPKLRNQVILRFENIRSEFFDNPFEKRLKELGQSMMKSYELCNYFRNPNPADNQIFLSTLLPVLYKNVPYQIFYQANQQRLKFSLNERFFDHLQKFLLEELKETDSKSILDLQIRISKLRIRAGVTYNFFQIINEDSETFFANLFPFLSSWIQKYNLTQMDSKALDFKFLEIFLKLCLNKQDYYSLMDSEPCLMHYVVNEFMITFWIKGISAYFEDKQVSKIQYTHLINFLSQYLLFKKEENSQKQNKN
ncbi:hypothetical protein ABPG72_008292 [Tetrahymena utriculariae]